MCGHMYLLFWLKRRETYPMNNRVKGVRFLQMFVLRLSQESI